MPCARGTVPALTMPASAPAHVAAVHSSAVAQSGVSQGGCSPAHHGASVPGTAAVHVVDSNSGEGACVIKHHVAEAVAATSAAAAAVGVVVAPARAAAPSAALRACAHVAAGGQEDEAVGDGAQEGGEGAQAELQQQQQHEGRPADAELRGFDTIARRAHAFQLDATGRGMSGTAAPVFLGEVLDTMLQHMHPQCSPAPGCKLPPGNKCTLVDVGANWGRVLFAAYLRGVHFAWGPEFADGSSLLALQQAVVSKVAEATTPPQSLLANPQYLRTGPFVQYNVMAEDIAAQGAPIRPLECKKPVRGL